MRYLRPDGREYVNGNREPRWSNVEFTSAVQAIDSAAQNLVASELLVDSAFNIASFGQSNTGELFVVNFGGTLHEIVAD